MYLKKIFDFYNVEFKEIVGGQIILTYGAVKYMVQPVENESFDLLLKRELTNNPKRKTRYKFIGNFKNIESIVNYIKERKIA